ncbi:MAG: hypothetical protein COW88_03575 [Candidatus Lloydbacteria bacterium CG22_combo_CG10-13_8_21_14_all_47_15]|uniref:DUF4015 domain-containing protein n=1 Tax=Candidatus Lloydbacteria bacterium CG22_combo_CG10-13_8_21_14_all_47_15 TaxID=1974635 RepID=A0A2H0CSZ1_9BACT|nr:MAG: hypothetical protein COW88_03575 [Candidatus Lloydbacteria bacterium CG22_combo_CG10-13_8_21_14_all_47_15]
MKNRLNTYIRRIDNAVGSSYGASATAFFSVIILATLFMPYALDDIYARRAFVGALVVYPELPPSRAAHVQSPEAVRAVYLTQCALATKRYRESVIRLINETELNAVVVDIKDYTGTIAFASDHALLRENGGDGCRAGDLSAIADEFHEYGIYIIGRITVFQDPWYALKHPEIAVQKESDRTVWSDYKGLHYIDPGAEDILAYIVAVGQEAWRLGIDELNFDYIRFPSDGNMKDIYYPVSEENIISDPLLGKAQVMRTFFAGLAERLAGARADGAVLSADLFGMTTTNNDDLNIGQILEYAEPYFDYLSPMVYPSHYPPRFIGYDNPNHYPYEVVKYAMDRGVYRLVAASSTPKKLRPWLQDFDYGGRYDAEKVRAQIQAVYDAGLNSWMLWDPAVRYERDALLTERTVNGE